MLKGENIICFSSVDWGHVPTTKKHIMPILARENRVLFIETYGSRGPNLSRLHLARIVRRLWNWLRGVRRLPVAGEMYIYSPLNLPWKTGPVAWLNNRAQMRALMRIVDRLALRRPILWYYLPTPVEFFGQLGEKAVVYHCEDEWATYPGGADERFLEQEVDLLQRADAVFVSNRLLLKSKKRFHPPARYLPHGCDFDHFASATTPGDVPADLTRLPQPRIGMIGGVAHWMDWRLLVRLARSHPEWSIVLIGPVSYNADTGPVQEAPNLHLLGLKPYSELPAYYRGIDVCIIAFASDEHIRYCAPSRLLEHLAAGKPVVSTDYPAAREFPADLVTVVPDTGKFVRAVEEALEQDTPEHRERRRSFARDNSWEARVEEMSKIISEKLVKKGLED